MLLKFTPATVKCNSIRGVLKQTPPKHSLLVDTTYKIVIAPEFIIFIDLAWLIHADFVSCHKYEFVEWIYELKQAWNFMETKFLTV